MAVKCFLNWNLNSWRNFPAEQSVAYADSELLSSIENQLAKLPPIVEKFDIIKLSSYLSEVAKGEIFLLHCGDCAETFKSTSQDLLNFRSLLQHVKEVFTLKTKMSMLQIGRVAGQFAKPRSSPVETRDNISLYNYRGDMVNSIEFDPLSRKPDPFRLLEGYNKSKSILDYLNNNTDFSDSNNFFKNDTEKIYSSHEALILNYEESLTRQIERQYYNLSAHFLWIGNSTRKLNNAHIEYIRGIQNPIGIKIDSNIHAEDLLRLVDTVNPDNQDNKLILISRMGKDNIEKYLPNLIYNLKKEEKAVIWICDPMHGNTKFSNKGHKVRYIEDIKDEISSFFAIQNEYNILGRGVHLESTADNVLECIGEKNDEDIMVYRTYCDPRLNSVQLLDIIEFISYTLQEK